MKHYGSPRPVVGVVGLLLLAALLAPSPITANSIIAGGFVPAIHDVSIAPSYGGGPARGDGSVEVAILEVDNNLEEFGLVLDFAGKSGNLPDISEVRLESLGGTLGTGLNGSASMVLRRGPVPGRFLWNPGRQCTATLGYRARVLVVYGSLPADPPLMMVGMPASY